MAGTRRRRGAPQQASTSEINAEDTKKPSAAAAAIDTQEKGKKKTLAAAAFAVSVCSAASDWRFARQYETNIWNPLFTMTAQFGVTAVVALAVGLSPTGRALTPGGASVRDPKKSFIGAALIALAFWLGFGLFGPCGLVTAVAATAAAILTLH